MSNQNRVLLEELEDRIIGKLIRELINNYDSIDMDFNEIIAYEYCSNVRKPVGWVKLVYDNGVDIISDYSQNLEGIINLVTKDFEKYY